MATVNNWKAQDQEKSEYVGILEFQSDDEEWHDFQIIKNETHFIFGNACNTGMLESGNYLIDPDFSFNQNLAELSADLESFYNDGSGFQSDLFACNEMM